MKKTFIFGLILFGLTACAPIVTTHGFNSYPQLETWVSKNTILKNELQSRFGSASFVDSYDDITSYYYVNFTKERYAFFRPDISERKIMVINFKNDQYLSHNQYTLKDGHDIAVASKTTPTYGKELSVIQEILSNIGKFNNVPGQRGVSDGSVLGPIPGGI